MNFLFHGSRRLFFENFEGRQKKKSVGTTSLSQLFVKNKY
jgi:hypothetical protein